MCVAYLDRITIRHSLYVGVLDTLCDKVCQWLAADRRFSPGIPVSSTHQTDRHNITDILLKAALNTINPTLYISFYRLCHTCSQDHHIQQHGFLLVFEDGSKVLYNSLLLQNNTQHYY